MIKKILNDVQIIRFFKLQSSQSKAITLNILSIVFFSIMVIFIRKAAENLHILEVVFFRNLLAFLVMIPILKSTGLSAIKMNNTKLFFMRGFFGAIGMLAGFTCLTLIPLAQATAISFSKPIFITIDPERDTPELIKDYLHSFGSKFIGITGEPEKIFLLSKSWGILKEKIFTEDGNYTLNHSSPIILLKNGKYADTIKQKDDIKKSLKKIKKIL